MRNISSSLKKDSKKIVAVFNLLIIFCVICILAGFLFQYDGLISQDYELRECKKALGEQEDMAKQLKVKMTELNSVDSLQGIAKDLNLVAAEKVKYLQSADSAMAISKNLNH